MNMRVHGLFSAALVAGALCLAPQQASAVSTQGFWGGHGSVFDDHGGRGRGNEERGNRGRRGGGPGMGPLADLLDDRNDDGRHGRGHGKRGGKKGKHYGGKKPHAPVPVPATLPLLLGGLGVIGLARRRKAAKQA